MSEDIFSQFGDIFGGGGGGFESFFGGGGRGGRWCTSRGGNSRRRCRNRSGGNGCGRFHIAAARGGNQQQSHQDHVLLHGLSLSPHPVGGRGEIESLNSRTNLIP